MDTEGLKPDPEKVRGIIEYPVVKNLKGLRRLHGMGIWYERFIPNFSELVEPFTRLTRKNVRFGARTRRMPLKH